MKNFQKLKYEIFVKMKNESDPALLRTSYLSKETIERTPNPHETILLKLVLLVRYLEE
jgi:hypothetical protein